MSTMTEGAVDVLEELDFEPPCGVGRDTRPGSVCERSAVWVMRIHEPPCEHLPPTLWCEPHYKLVLKALAQGVRFECKHCAALIPTTSICWQRLR